MVLRRGPSSLADVLLLLQHQSTPGNMEHERPHRTISTVEPGYADAAAGHQSASKHCQSFLTHRSMRTY